MRAKGITVSKLARLFESDYEAPVLVRYADGTYEVRSLTHLGRGRTAAIVATRDDLVEACGGDVYLESLQRVVAEWRAAA